MPAEVARIALEGIADLRCVLETMSVAAVLCTVPRPPREEAPRGLFPPPPSFYGPPPRRGPTVVVQHRHGSMAVDPTSPDLDDSLDALDQAMPTRH